MIQKYFENIKYGSYSQSSDFDDLPIEYEQRLFTKSPIDCLTYNTLEMLKVGPIEQSFDNRMYESNLRNANFVDLNFDGDQILISGK